MPWFRQRESVVLDLLDQAIIAAKIEIDRATNPEPEPEATTDGQP